MYKFNRPPFEDENWPPFFFETDAIAGVVYCQAQWSEIANKYYLAYPSGSPYDCRQNTNQQQKDCTPIFGSQAEHQSSYTLRDFFNRHNLPLL